MLSVIIGKKPLFLPEFFEKIYQLDYPKDKLFLYVVVQNITKYHYVKESLRLWKNEYRYRIFTFYFLHFQKKNIFYKIPYFRKFNPSLGSCRAGSCTSQLQAAAKSEL